MESETLARAGAYLILQLGPPSSIRVPRREDLLLIGKHVERVYLKKKALDNLRLIRCVVESG